MMKRLLLLALLAASCAAPPLTPPPGLDAEGSNTPATAAAAPLPPPPSGVRLTRAAAPVRYSATLTVVPGYDVLEGRIDIDLTLAEATDVLWLNAVELTVDEAHLDVGGRKLAARVVPGNDDVIGFAFEARAPAGPARLTVSYRGKISPKDDRGVFLEEDEGRRYVFTQFENIEARRAFPCFDEPSFKVPWQLTLRVPRDEVALANTPALSETAEGGMKVIRFAETRPLPTYLVAFAVGPFELVDAGKAGRSGAPVRIAVPRGEAATARWAAETTPALIGLLEDYFGIPYPYEKLDIVPLPRTASFGAMENAGLITIRASLALAAGAEETLVFKRTYASYMAHELAHHWFGDLVTLEFWDDIWLNEAFAEWMGSKTIARWKPEWDEGAFRVSQTSWAMRSDALTTARKIRQEVTTKDDIQNAFDDITYEKGSAVLGMFESWVGAERFQKGIRRYLTEHAHANATSRDFLSALTAEAGQDVVTAFSTFLDQPGFPLIRGEPVCEQGKPPRVRLTQERFLPVGSRGAPSTWQVPVCVRYAAGASEGRACMLLTGTSAEFPLSSAPSCPDWVFLNENGAGYYRASYPSAAQGALLRKAGKRLSVIERMSLAEDAGALARAGKLPAADALSLVTELARDPSPHVVRSVVQLVLRIPDSIIPEDVRPHFARFVQKAFGKKARELGLRPRRGDDEHTRLLRPLLVLLVADRGQDQALIAEAQRLTARWLDDNAAVEPDAIENALWIAASHGDRKLWSKLRGELTKASDQLRRSRILSALASFLDPALVNESLSIILSSELDARDAIDLLYQDPRMADVVFAFVKQHFDALVARLPGEPQGDLPRVGEPFCDEAHRADLEAFFKDRTGKLTGGPRSLAQTLEAISLCSALREAQKESLTAFLKKQ